MKKHNSQLDDAMILALADSYDMGVDFSHAANIIEIPEMLMSEAKEYWNLLSKQNEVAHQIFPEDSIVDSLLSKMDAPVPEQSIKIAAPSPYMKYVMAFAVPLSILVMVIGVAYRKDSNSGNLTLNNPMDESAAFSVQADGGEIIQSDGDISGAIQPRVSQGFGGSPDNTDSAEAASPRALMGVANMKMMAASEPAPSTADIQNKDPKQLLAMLTDTGSHESESDTNIDEEFDARVVELNSKVIGNNANPYDETK